MHSGIGKEASAEEKTETAREEGKRKASRRRKERWGRNTGEEVSPGEERYLFLYVRKKERRISESAKIRHSGPGILASSKDWRDAGVLTP